MVVNLEVPKTLSPTTGKTAPRIGRRRKTNVSPHRKSFLEKLKDYFVPAEDTAGGSAEGEKAWLTNSEIRRIDRRRKAR